ncbi:hypothetical protein F8388_024017 [Cannabis sativa]|uniref:Pentatricopeptide repeat-containing protein n=1 Tax=Cannabis sativa TaxID=3483 RepID=A0A7J6FXF0_CANSA|nr:hypothetical protein F8388_024017 [Cannabis sativa]
MRSLGHTPNAQTFHSMITAYAAIGGNYTEVTELWGEMKSLASATPMKFDQELLDSVLYTFVRGGFFSRANEVVEMMEKGIKVHPTMQLSHRPSFPPIASLENLLPVATSEAEMSSVTSALHRGYDELIFNHLFTHSICKT